LLRTSHPGLAEVLFGLISLDYHETLYIALSSGTGEGFDKWLSWLNTLQQKVQPQAAAVSS
jgi:Ni,Fe-hydrogenase I small subunit